MVKLTITTLPGKLGRRVELAALERLDMADAQVDDTGTLKKLVKLETVDFKNNRIRFIRQLEGLLEAPALLDLDLRGNPVCRVKQYRLEVIARAHTLRLLDGIEISAGERHQAYVAFPDKAPADFDAAAAAVTVDPLALGGADEPEDAEAEARRIQAVRDARIARDAADRERIIREREEEAIRVAQEKEAIARKEREERDRLKAEVQSLEPKIMDRGTLPTTGPSQAPPPVGTRDHVAAAPLDDLFAAPARKFDEASLFGTPMFSDPPVDEVGDALGDLTVDTSLSDIAAPVKPPVRQAAKPAQVKSVEDELFGGSSSTAFDSDLFSFPAQGAAGKKKDTSVGASFDIASYIQQESQGSSGGGLFDCS